MSQLNHKNIVRSIREFLKMEDEIYGSFHFPEVAESKNMDSASSELSDTTTVGISKKPHPPSPAGEASRENPAPETSVEEVTSLELLREVCLESEALRTDLKNTNLVFGTGNPDADIMFIGEAPGAQEDQQGEPFVGKAGQLLTKILAAINFQRDDVYIANILKHRPPNNRDPLPEERQRSLPFLYRQIDLIQPKWIVCLGRISAQTLLQTTKPMKLLRGTFHPFHDDIELMVTFHPAALLRNPAWKRDTWEDVQMLRKRYDEVTGSSRH